MEAEPYQMTPDSVLLLRIPKQVSLLASQDDVDGDVK